MRTRKQIGELAVAIYDQLAKVEFTREELTIFGNGIWSKKSIYDLEQVPNPETGKLAESRVATNIKMKLIKASEELDKILPLSEAPPPAPPPVDPAFEVMRDIIEQTRAHVSVPPGNPQAPHPQTPSASADGVEKTNV